jgi:hypothetical protein
LPEPNSEFTAELPLPDPLEFVPVPVLLAPESLTEVAETVPLALLAPWMTTESPG